MTLPFQVVGEGPAMLLIHGAAEDADMLAPQAHAFAARGRRVAWYSRRGTGSTPDIGFAVPWSVLEIPDDQFEIAYAHGGALVRAILAVTRRRFVREHRTAFRYLPAGPGSPYWNHSRKDARMEE